MALTKDRIPSEKALNMVLQSTNPQSPRGAERACWCLKKAKKKDRIPLNSPSEKDRTPSKNLKERIRIPKQSLTKIG